MSRRAMSRKSRGKSTGRCICALYHLAPLSQGPEIPLPYGKHLLYIMFVYAEQPRSVRMAKPGRGFWGRSSLRRGDEDHAKRGPEGGYAGASRSGPRDGTVGGDRKTH